MLGPRKADIDPVLLLHKVARTRSHHRDKHQVKLAALRRVNGEDLIIDVRLCKPFSNLVFLGVVGRDNIDAILGKFLDGYFIVLSVHSIAFVEDREAKIGQLSDNLCFFIVIERGTFEPLPTLVNIDEQEWTWRVHELLLKVALVAASDPVLIVKHIWHFHERSMHSVLLVQEIEMVSCLDQARKE